jgi:hypothetical protein
LKPVNLCAHPGRTVETWKTPLDGAKEHRLEAYATMLSGVSSGLSKYFLRRGPRTPSHHASTGFPADRDGSGIICLTPY